MPTPPRDGWVVLVKPPIDVRILEDSASRMATKPWFVLFEIAGELRTFEVPYKRWALLLKFALERFPTEEAEAILAGCARAR